MIEISDFTNLTQEQESALVRLFNTRIFQDVFPVGVTNGVKLSHVIVRHLNSWEGKRFPSVRWEVLAHRPCAEDSQGKLYDSLYTLSLAEKVVPQMQTRHQSPSQAEQARTPKYELKIKTRKPDNRRVVKVQNFATKPLKRVQAEHSFLIANSMFHCKPLTYSDTDSYLVMRKLPGVRLSDYLKGSNPTIAQRFILSIALLRALKNQITSKEFVHRKINMDNILVVKKPNQFVVSIVGYGSMTKQGDDAPPKYFRENKNIDPRFDIYSMGRVLMYVWGDDYTEDRTNTKDFPAIARNFGFSNLFKKMTELPDVHEAIRSTFMLIFAEKVEDIPTINELLRKFNELKDNSRALKKARIEVEEEPCVSPRNNM